MPTGRVAAQTAAGSAEPSAPDTIILSEADVLRIALSENATVRVADLDVRKQAYARRAAQADLLPKVDVNGVYSRTLKKQVMYIDMPGFGSGDGIEVGRTHNTQATLNVTMPLISAQLWKNIAMTGEQLDLALEQARSSRIDLVATVRKAYLSVLLAQDS
ncbi:TolC family protein, partial [Bacteroides heparinolyticus]